MSLLTYEDARPWARAIKQKTSRAPDDPERMPPWFIEKNVGIQKFKDDPSLTDQEIALIGTWADKGAPRGNPADMPAIHLTEGAWSIGTPDLVVSSPSMKLPAVAPDFYGRIGPAPTGLTEDRYIKAVEFRERRLDAGAAERKAGDLNYFAVHHAVIARNVRDQRGTGRRGGPGHRDDGGRKPRGRAFQCRLGAGAERDDLSGCRSA